MYILKKDTYIILLVTAIVISFGLYLTFTLDHIILVYPYLALLVFIILTLQFKTQQKINCLFHEMFEQGILKHYDESQMMKRLSNAFQGYYLANMKACYQMNKHDENKAIAVLEDYIHLYATSKKYQHYLQFSLIHLIIIKLICHQDITLNLSQLKSYQHITNTNLDVLKMISFFEKYQSQDKTYIEDTLEYKMPYYFRIQLLYLLGQIKQEEKRKIYDDLCSIDNDYYIKQLIEEGVHV